eukprot:9956124-Alexandrium_andersonii.AAC.1
MSASLVGSEMCIRDSASASLDGGFSSQFFRDTTSYRTLRALAPRPRTACLLYTSDAADDM